MRSMKHFVLPVVLLVVAALAGRPAPAAAADTQKLTPPPGSPFPDASGVVTTTIDGPYRRWVWDPRGYGVGSWIRYYDLHATFQVWGLAPSTVYCIASQPSSGGLRFTTDESGNASGTFYAEVSKRSTPSYEVYYFDFDNNRVVVLE